MTAIRKRKVTPVAPAGYLSAEQLREYLGLANRATLTRWLDADPTLRALGARTLPNGRHFWLRDEVDAWLRSRCFATPDPTSAGHEAA